MSSVFRWAADHYTTVIAWGFAVAIVATLDCHGGALVAVALLLAFAYAMGHATARDEAGRDS